MLLDLTILLCKGLLELFAGGEGWGLLQQVTYGAGSEGSLGDSGQDVWLHEGAKQHEAMQARLGLRACACFSQHLER